MAKGVVQVQSNDGRTAFERHGSVSFPMSSEGGE